MHSNIPQVATGNMSTVSDDYPGGGGASPGFAQGQLGKSFWVDENWPGIDERCRVQYVKMDATLTATPAKGTLCYWNDHDDYEVTIDDPSTVGLPVAGVLIGAVPAAGKYGFIQKCGRATVKFKSSTTKTTPAAGDAVVGYGGSGLADVLADATAVTFGTDATQANRVIGHLVEGITTQLARVDLFEIPD